MATENWEQRYGQMNPVRRNGELKRIFASAPDIADLAGTHQRRQELLRTFFGSSDDISGEIRKSTGTFLRRQRSSLGHLMPARLDILLGYAVITDIGRAHVKQAWKDLFTLGLGGDFLDKYPDPLAEYGRQFGWEPQGQKGVFSNKRAFTLEREWYRTRRRLRTAVKSIIKKNRNVQPDPELLEALADFEAELTSSSTPQEMQGLQLFQDTILQTAQHEDTLLKSWKKEIIALHGRKP